MFATILFMCACGVADLVLEVCLFLSYPSVNMRAVLGSVVLDFTTVRHILPCCVHSIPSTKAYATQIFFGDCC
jgi:hypothetical protein